jgi:hypothetical protein
MAQRQAYCAPVSTTLKCLFTSATKAAHALKTVRTEPLSVAVPYRFKYSGLMIEDGVSQSSTPLAIYKHHSNRLPLSSGVRSPTHIKKGQFVDRYVGEIITSTEADRRRSAAAISQRKDVYLFALDKFTDLDSLDPRLKGPPLEVDGEFMAGPTRFVNHSCDPNMRVFARVGDHADKHIHDLALFAIKNIPKGTELTFDYVDGVAYEGEEPEGDQLDHMTRCLCGSKNCRKFLW